MSAHSTEPATEDAAAKRFKPHIVERALARLRADLVRDGVGGSPLNDRIPAAPDDNQQPSAVPSPSAST